MKGRKFFSSIAASVLIAGMALTGISSSAGAEEVRNNDPGDGVIRSNSPTYRFRNMWSPGTPVEQLRGQEYTFSAEAGDEIEVNLDMDRGGFSPVLVLFHAIVTTIGLFPREFFYLSHTQIWRVQTTGFG